jgi:hypothetical protein
MVLADIGLTLGQSNQYLPPNAGPPGYDYPKPPAPSPVSFDTYCIFVIYNINHVISI